MPGLIQFQTSLFLFLFLDFCSSETLLFQAFFDENDSDNNNDHNNDNNNFFRRVGAALSSSSSSSSVFVIVIVVVMPAFSTPPPVPVEPEDVEECVALLRRVHASWPLEALVELCGGGGGDTTTVVVTTQPAPPTAALPSLPPHPSSDSHGV